MTRMPRTAFAQLPLVLALCLAMVLIQPALAQTPRDLHTAPKGDGRRRGEECAKLGEELIKCIELSRQRVCRVHIRNVNVDLEIADECDEYSD